MKQNKLATGLISLALTAVLLAPGLAGAVERPNFAVTANQVTPVRSSTTSAVKRLQEKVDDLKAKLAGTREQRVKGLINAVGVRENVMNRLITAGGRLLDKLQVRIDRAQKAGRDVAGMTTLMSDARAKLADAKSILTQIDGQKGTAATKADFTKIHGEFQAARKDIQGVKEDAAKIIRILKGYNSATNSAVEADRESTRSGDRD